MPRKIILILGTMYKTNFSNIGEAYNCLAPIALASKLLLLKNKLNFLIKLFLCTLSFHLYKINVKLHITECNSHMTHRPLNMTHFKLLSRD